ncbi:hypothetical protein GGX14DRAFT_397335 [Mycena pura]|uniref:Uncharacterized protein n=1 Tax=Mycena pura TaxID=153505 RepID=A0AAD6V8J4_9AGAR|nr:hypothetical protein GGX14DRAFT_397335 [Mycena pura]
MHKYCFSLAAGLPSSAQPNGIIKTLGKGLPGRRADGVAKMNPSDLLLVLLAYKLKRGWVGCRNWNFLRLLYNDSGYRSQRGEFDNATSARRQRLDQEVSHAHVTRIEHAPQCACQCLAFRQGEVQSDEAARYTPAEAYKQQADELHHDDRCRRRVPGFRKELAQTEPESWMRNWIVSSTPITSIPSGKARESIFQREPAGEAGSRRRAGSTRDGHEGNISVVMFRAGIPDRARERTLRLSQDHKSRIRLRPVAVARAHFCRDYVHVYSKSEIGVRFFHRGVIPHIMHLAALDPEKDAFASSLAHFEVAESCGRTGFRDDPSTTSGIDSLAQKGRIRQDTYIPATANPEAAERVEAAGHEWAAGAAGTGVRREPACHAPRVVLDAGGTSLANENGAGGGGGGGGGEDGEDGGGFESSWGGGGGASQSAGVRVYRISSSESSGVDIEEGEKAGEELAILGNKYRGGKLTSRSTVASVAVSNDGEHLPHWQELKEACTMLDSSQLQA